jgi:hypothetical protein
VVQVEPALGRPGQLQVSDGGRIEGARQYAHPAAVDAVRPAHQDGLGRIGGLNVCQRLPETEKAPEIGKVVRRRALLFPDIGAIFLGKIHVTEGTMKLHAGAQHMRVHDELFVAFRTRYLDSLTHEAFLSPVACNLRIDNNLTAH